MRKGKRYKEGRKEGNEVNKEIEEKEKEEEEEEEIIEARKITNEGKKI